MIEFSDESVGTEKVISVPIIRQGFYYRALNGRRLYFSGNEIRDILPRPGYYLLVLHTGAQFKVRSSMPDEVGFEAPIRASIKGDHFFLRS